MSAAASHEVGHHVGVAVGAQDFVLPRQKAHRVLKYQKVIYLFICLFVRFTSEQKHENSVADPGSGAFLTPGSGMNNERPGSYFRELRNNFWVKNTVRFKMQGLIIINKVYQVFQI
jgi:hypothetical protein